MAKKRQAVSKGGTGFERRSVTLDRDLVVEVETALLSLRHGGKRVSFSGFIEAAARELLGASNLAKVLDRHEARARR
jgi:hypothetical protein